MAENSFPCCVIDCSFLATFLLSSDCSNEDKASIERISSIIESNGQLYVPQLFWFEIGNVLLNASKKNKEGKARISIDQKLKIERALENLPIYTDIQPDSEIRSRINSYAQEYNLSYYDAAYLELARRYSLPLLTYDKNLLEAYKSITV